MTPEKVKTAAQIAREKFESEYAASLKKDNIEALQLALGILDRHQKKYKLTPTERQIIEQMELLSSPLAIRKIIVSEMLSRKKMNRKTRRHYEAIMRSLSNVKARSVTQADYLEAVRTGRTAQGVQIERLNAERAAKEIAETVEAG